MSDLSVIDALKQRKSVRSFSEREVPRALLQELLQSAVLSASGSNLQPWKIYALSGEAKQLLIQTVGERLMENPRGEEADIPIYPKGLRDPWRQRSHDCAELMYGALDIARDDKTGRLLQVMKNFSFFGAPVGLIFTVDRHLSESQILDTGILAQSIMLVAKQLGLDTCAQACWTMWPNTIREVLRIEQNEMVVLGMSLGYADTTQAVNKINQQRLAVPEFASLRGFAD